MQEVTVTLKIDSEGKITVVSNEVAPSAEEDTVHCYECDCVLEQGTGAILLCNVCEELLCEKCFGTGHGDTCEGLSWSGTETTCARCGRHPDNNAGVCAAGNKFNWCSICERYLCRYCMGTAGGGDVCPLCWHSRPDTLHRPALAAIAKEILSYVLDEDSNSYYLNFLARAIAVMVDSAPDEEFNEKRDEYLSRAFMVLDDARSGI
jgi:hypothetical protein